MTVSLHSFLLAILPSRNGVPCKKKLIWLTVQSPKSFFLWNPSYWSLQQRALYVPPISSQTTKTMCAQELLFKKINIFCCPIKDILKLAFCCYFVCFLLLFVHSHQVRKKTMPTFIVWYHRFAFVLRCPSRDWPITAFVQPVQIICPFHKHSGKANRFKILFW